MRLLFVVTGAGLGFAAGLALAFVAGSVNAAFGGSPFLALDVAPYFGQCYTSHTAPQDVGKGWQ